MSVQSLDQRITAMVADQQTIPLDFQSEQSIAQEDSQLPMPDQQVAGLGGLEDVFKVIKQGTKSTETLRDIAKQNANAIEIIREEAAAAKKAADAAQKAKALKDKPKVLKKDNGTQLVEPAPITSTTTDIPVTDPLPTNVEALVPDVAPVNLATERLDLIPVIDPAKIKAFLSGEISDDVPFDISFKNIKDPADIDYVVRKTQEIFADEIFAAKRGVISDAELNKLADDLNMEQDLLKKQVGTVFNAEQIQASKAVLAASSRKINEMTLQIKQLAAESKNDDALLIDFTNQLGLHSAMMMNFKAAKSEAARALRASRVYTDADGAVDIEKVNSMIAELGGSNNIKNVVNLVELLDDAQKAKFIQQGGTNLEKFGSVWKELWMGSLMSAPATWERGFFGQMLMTFMRPLDTAFAATAGRALDIPYTALKGSEANDFVSLAESAIEFANFFSSIPNGWRAASQAWKTDTPIYGVGRNVDNLPDPAISAKLFKDPNSPIAQAVDYGGKAVRLGFRNALFVDEGTKAMVAQMEVKRLAARDAMLSIKNGMDPEESLLMMAENISNPSTETLERIHSAVKEGSLQSDLGSFGNWVMQTRTKLDENSLGIPFGTLLAPFVKTVINAEKQILARTPLAPLMSEVQAELKAGGARRQMALGKIAQGSSMMGMAYWMTTEGMLTGLGPPDPKMRQFLKENTGWQECSIKYGDKYYSIAGLEPVGGLLCAAATVAEIGSVYGKEEDDTWGDLLLYSAILPFKYIGQLPMMDGMGKFMDMVQEMSRDPKGERAGEVMNKFFGSYAQNLAGGVTPVPMPFAGLLRQIERTIDPTKREVTLDPSLPTEIKYFDFALRSWMAGTPIMSEQLKPKRNFWGEEVTVGEYGALQWVFPFYKKNEINDPLSMTLKDLSIKRGKMIVSYPEKSAENIKLNDNEYSDLLESMNKLTLNGGKTLRQQIGNDIAEFKSETDGGRYLGLANKLSSTVSEYKKAALDAPKFKADYPDLTAKISNNKTKADLHIDRIKRETQE
jgi:hypothetical protein